MQDDQAEVQTVSKALPNIKLIILWIIVSCVCCIYYFRTPLRIESKRPGVEAGLSYILFCHIDYSRHDACIYVAYSL